jgi:hypothetical protein
LNYKISFAPKIKECSYLELSFKGIKQEDYSCFLQSILDFVLITNPIANSYKKLRDITITQETYKKSLVHFHEDTLKIGFIDTIANPYLSLAAVEYSMMNSSTRDSYGILKEFIYAIPFVSCLGLFPLYRSQVERIYKELYEKELQELIGSVSKEERIALIERF